MDHKFLWLAILTGVSLTTFTPDAQSQTEIWQETIIIATYQLDKPDPNPRFYDGRVIQGAWGRVYSYAMSDVLLLEKRDQTYEIHYLEEGRPEIDEEFARSYYYNGLVADRLGDEETAAFKAALELNPNHPWAKAHLGEIETA